MSSESKGIIHDGLDLLLPGFLGDVVEIAIGVRVFEVNGGGEDVGFECFKADSHFHGAGGPEQMAEAGFGGADGDFFGMSPQNGFDGLGFADIALWSGSAVGVDVVDLVGIHSGVF